MANLNIRLDDELKTSSFNVIQSYGLSPSQFIRLVLKQVADTGNLPLSFEKQPNAETLQAMNEIKQGQGIKFNSVDELMADL